MIEFPFCTTSADVTVVCTATSTTATITWEDGGDPAGVREPRRPLLPSLDGAVALDLPEDVAA